MKDTKRPLRILLGDLCHLHPWEQARPVPLNIGYLAAYLHQECADVEIELFKEAHKLLGGLRQGRVDVVALSHYDWNSNLDLAVLRHVRALQPDATTVLGGPDFDADDPAWVDGFLRDRPEVDAYLSGEGEWSFAWLVRRLVAHGGRWAGLLREEELPASLYAYDHTRGRVIHDPSRPVERLDLSTIPSPYLGGWMDPFLPDARLAPIFETNRGCPYSCTFCCWGQATQSKIRRFPLATVLAEIDYAFSRSRNPNGFAFLADGNFGILPRDLEIAEAIEACRAELGRPRRIFIYFAKNTNERVVEIADRLSAVTSMSMSKQSLDADVLAAIRRSNIPPAQYDRLRDACDERGIDSYCELIYGLPGETYESFVAGVRSTLRKGQRVTLYPHIMIKGAESSSQAYRQRYGIQTALRVFPSGVSPDPDLPCLEYEEIVIATDALPFEDYLRIRLFQFLHVLLGREAFSELERALTSFAVDLASVVDQILDDEDGWPRNLRSVLEAQRSSYENELIPPEQGLTRFTDSDLRAVHSDPGIFRLLADGVATAELWSYLARLIREDLSLDPEGVDEALLALGFSFDRLIRWTEVEPTREIEVFYDLETWMSNPQLRLRDVRSTRPHRYLLRADTHLLRVIEETHRRLGDLSEALFRVRQTLNAGRMGDRLFTYERVPLAEGESTDRQMSNVSQRRREVAEDHSRIADRQS